MKYKEITNKYEVDMNFDDFRQVQRYLMMVRAMKRSEARMRKDLETKLYHIFDEPTCSKDSGLGVLF